MNIFLHARCIVYEVCLSLSFMLCHITIIKAIATACYSTMTRLLPEDCTGDSTWPTSEGGLDRSLAVVPILIESIRKEEVFNFLEKYCNA